MSTNKPAGSNVFVELTPELAEFVIANCDANLIFALNAMQGGVVKSEDGLRTLVAQMEQFKALKKAVEAAR